MDARYRIVAVGDFGDYGFMVAAFIFKKKQGRKGLAAIPRLWLIDSGLMPIRSSHICGVLRIESN